MKQDLIIEMITHTAIATKEQDATHLNQAKEYPELAGLQH